MSVGTPTSLAPVTHNASSATLASASCAPNPGDFIGVCIASTGGLNGESLLSVSSAFSIVGSWQFVGNTPAALSQCGVYFAYAFASGSPGTGAVTITMNASNPADLRMQPFSFTGVDTTTPVVGAVTGNGNTATTPALTVSQAPTINDLLIGVFGARNRAGAITVGTSFTAFVNDFTTPNPTATMLGEYRGSTTSTAVGASVMGTVYNGGVGLVLKAAAAPGTTFEGWGVAA